MHETTKEMSHAHAPFHAAVTKECSIILQTRNRRFWALSLISDPRGDRRSDVTH